MLVLSRRQDEKIVFPQLGITVEVLRIAGRSVRLGVTAPSNIRVLRHELAGKLGDEAERPSEAVATSKSNHRLRNRLNKATIGLQLAQMQLELGRHDEADRTLETVLAEFEHLESDLGGEPEVVRAPEVAHHQRRALLVEDDANEIELLAAYLRLSGYRVDTASDGCDALDYLAENCRPDVVLLDMQMPCCDGPSTISAIRENPKFRDLKVFAVSGKVAAEMGVTIGPGGVDRWFRKPLDAQSLVTQLNRDLARDVAQSAG
jgi:carbon storage regulator CsrA